MFIENASDLFIPLLVMIVASDLVSSENSQGTIKLLLTRPVQRWKILMSKYVTLLLAVSMIVAMTGALAYLLSGMVFGYRGWTAPIITGFAVNAGNVDTSGVRLISQWQLLFMDFGLVWYVAVVVATLS